VAARKKRQASATGGSILVDAVLSFATPMLNTTLDQVISYEKFLDSFFSRIMEQYLSKYYNYFNL
jgi:hypothetical protein